MTIPQTQRQWQTSQRGLPKDALKLVLDAPVPIPRQGEVLVKISHSSINPGSLRVMGSPLVHLRRGAAVPETEASGWVVDANGSAEFKEGDEVIGAVGVRQYILGGVGTLSEYVAFQADLLFHKPATLSMESAPALVSGGTTVYKALVEEGHFQPGQRIFINGGTSAMGMAGIQIAKILGAAEVVVSCSAESFELVEKLGADRAIDYKTAPLSTTLTNLFSNDSFDFIFDCIGHRSLFTASPGFLKPDGTFMCIASALPEGSTWFDFFRAIAQSWADTSLPMGLGGIPRKYIFSRTPPARHRIVPPLKWAAEGKLSFLVDSVHASDKDGVMAAYERVKSGRAKGKVLIDLQQS